MSTGKIYNVKLFTRSFYAGTVEANSIEDAIERTFHVWRTECPHPFERIDDDELVDVQVDEVTP